MISLLKCKYAPHSAHSKLKEEFNQIRLKGPPSDLIISQIKKDVRRTFSHHEALSSDLARQGIQNTLETLALRFPEIGYVQGINFIVATCYYHADQYYSYGIILTLFEMLDMRDIYLPSKIFEPRSKNQSSLG